MTSSVDYRPARERLARVFAELDFKSAAAVLDFQIQLIDEICRAESASTPEAKDHIMILRAFGDALAHGLLTTHALRQLAKNEGATQPSLMSQGQAFLNTKSMAERLSSDGSLVLFADINNIVKIGDLIVCDYPDIPSIVECKSKLPKTQHLLQGRRGRQFERAFESVKYMKEGHRISGSADRPERLLATTESDVPISWVWSAVETALSSLTDQQVVSMETEPGAGLVAISRQTATSNIEFPDFAKRMRRLAYSPHTEILFGTPFYAPPLSWPLPISQRIALMEADYLLFRFLDIISLQESFLKEGLSLSLRDPKDEDYLFDILNLPHPIQHLSMSHRPSRDVVFGYQTVSSTARFHTVATNRVFQRSSALLAPVQPEALGVGIFPMQPNIFEGVPGMIIVSPALGETSGTASDEQQSSRPTENSHGDDTEQ